MTDVKILEDEEIIPEKRYLVMSASYLKCKIARGRLDAIKNRLIKLRDARKPKMSPEIYGIEVILKNLSFDKKTVLQDLTLSKVTEPELKIASEKMVEMLFKEMGFDPDDDSQTKLKEEEEDET